MPAPNPPSPPNASRRWMLTPLKRAGSRSRSSADRGLVSITMRGLTPARTSRPSGRVAGSKHVCDDYAVIAARSGWILMSRSRRPICSTIASFLSSIASGQAAAGVDRPRQRVLRQPGAGEYKLYLAIENIDQLAHQDQEPASERYLRALAQDRVQRTLPRRLPQRGVPLNR